MNKRAILRISLLCAMIMAVGVTLQAGISAEQINIAKALHKSKLVPVAIIGAGPAGLSAAVYTARAQIPTYVFTGGSVGGHLNDIQQIENWPALPRTSGESIAKRLEEQAVGFGAHIVNDTVTAVDFNRYPFKLTMSNGDIIHALSVVIATGFLQRNLIFLVLKRIGVMA